MHNTQQYLQQLQQQLSQRLQAVQTDLAKTYSANSVEQAQQRENDEVLQQLSHQLHAELQQAEQAIKREAAGQYGICQHCGGEIAPARLQLLPFALTCVKCAG